MTNYSFQENLDLFSEKLGSALPNTSAEGVTLSVDSLLIDLLPLESGLLFSLPLGHFLSPPDVKKLQELATSNYLGLGTGGCTMSLDETGTLLTLRLRTSSSTTPEENWERFLQIFTVGKDWHDQLGSWDDFLPQPKRK